MQLAITVKTDALNPVDKTEITVLSVIMDPSNIGRPSKDPRMATIAMSCAVDASSEATSSAHGFVKMPQTMA